mmetsp:Transcript_13153/g.31163  ORF Transcript_13153/g.31163 Transcript_13153/m.31163 type:complete len:202 (-) Transcript_13153:2573-3178(-)
MDHRSGHGYFHPSVRKIGRKDLHQRQVPPVEWLVIHDMAQFLPKKTSHLTNVIEQAVRKGAQQVVLTWYGQARSTIIKPWETLMRKLTKDDTNMATTVQFVTGDQSKAHINTPHTFILTANKSVTRAWNKVLRNIQNDQYAQPRTIEEILDPPNDNPSKTSSNQPNTSDLPANSRTSSSRQQMDKHQRMSERSDQENTLPY